MVENAELPVVEEPKTETKVETDVDGLMAELEKAGVTNADELSGKLRASQEAGRSAQLLGDERKRTANLEQRLKDMEIKLTPQQDFMDYPEGQPIDIETAIAKGVNKVLDSRDAKARKAQEANYAAWNRIQNDEDYHLVREVFEEKLRDPTFVFKVQSGQIDPVNEYQTTLRKYYKTLLKKSHETITTMKGGKLEPPHVETGEQAPANIVSETPAGTESTRRMNDLREKVDKGHIMSQEEELSVIDSLFDSPVIPDIPPAMAPRK
ncbi:MAG: hypothetical protein JRJ43_10195 [Deltaproteobacteria bacterium]|nr:hypothetical protein [Deltaproteobacteria bacterium]